MSFKDVPPSHPRYRSLLMRHLITEGGKKSIVAESGLIAHGRGEAFDYLLGEETKPFALKAIEAAAALILESERPVFSVNGNAAALCPDEIAEIERISPIGIEINLFYRTPKREKAILKHLKKHGVKTVLGVKKSDTLRLSSLDHARRIVDRNGIAAADTVMIPLEDGDRAEALVREGKKNRRYRPEPAFAHGCFGNNHHCRQHHPRSAAFNPQAAGNGCTLRRRTPKNS